MDEELFLQYGTSITASKPMVKNFVSTQIFTPIVMLSFNGQKRSFWKSFYWTDELSFGNMLAGKKIASISESEKDLSLSLGLNYGVKWSDRHSLEVKWAGVRTNGLDYEVESKSGFDADRFNYLASFNYKNLNHFNFSGNTLLSSDRKILLGDLRGGFSQGDVDVSGQYEYISSEIENRFEDNLRNLIVLSSYSPIDNLKFGLETRYDLSQKSFADETYKIQLALGTWQYDFYQKFKKKTIFSRFGNL